MLYQYGTIYVHTHVRNTSTIFIYAQVREFNKEIQQERYCLYCGGANMYVIHIVHRWMIITGYYVNQSAVLILVFNWAQGTGSY